LSKYSSHLTTIHPSNADSLPEVVCASPKPTAKGYSHHTCCCTREGSNWVILG